MLWRGAIPAIPDGWQLCDGTNGTPDLRNRFVVGAGDTYNPNNSGGSVDHNHTFTTDGHDHGFAGGANIAAGVPWHDRVTSSVDSGTTNTDDHLPPYYALAYIMLM